MIKRFFILVAISFASQMAIGQVFEGVIHYELRVDVHRSIPPERAGLKAMIPQFRSENFQLLFTPHERLYKPYIDINEMASRRGSRMFGSPQMEVYVNTENQQWITFHEFMGRDYLIVDSINIGPWRLGKEYMEIAGFRCQMAWYLDTVSNEEITAWFTLEIQPFIGPDRFPTLPGAILALDVNNGERVWIARRIEKREIEDDEITRPEKGKIISRAEYMKMVEEQMERMRSMPGFRF